MKNPENIIYVVLIIGSIIWSIVKKFTAQKKNNTPQHQRVPSSKPERSLEDIFRELAGEIEPQPQPVKVKPSEQPTPKPQYSATPQPIMNDSLAMERGISTRYMPQNTQQPHLSVDLKNISDWQHAFIYSEIFNRKY